MVLSDRQRIPLLDPSSQKRGVVALTVGRIAIRLPGNEIPLRTRIVPGSPFHE
jgi:hypothetical protein